MPCFGQVVISVVCGVSLTFLLLRSVEAVPLGVAYYASNVVSESVIS